MAKGADLETAERKREPKTVPLSLDLETLATILDEIFADDRKSADKYGALSRLPTLLREAACRL